MIWYVLWVFTSNYAEPVGRYPGVLSCAAAAVELNSSWEQGPRPFMHRLACIPTLDLMGARPPVVVPRSVPPEPLPGEVS